MKIILVNRFFYPDHSATSQMLTDLAFYFGARGYDVHVITSMQLYNQPDAHLLRTETVNRVIIHRIQTTRFGRGGLLGRALDYLSFYILAYRSVRRLGSRRDLLIAKTDPPLLSLAMLHAVKSRK